MSCGMIALERAGIPVDNYYASEVDKWCIKVSEKNYPQIIRLGDVRFFNVKALPRIDLLIAGSPCQGFSFAGLGLNFDDDRSRLFFDFARIWKELRLKNPCIKFLLENVRMKKEHLKVISDIMGVQPVLINSALVSAQNRNRYFWTNIRVKTIDLLGTRVSDIPLPGDKGILLKDILQDNVEGKYHTTIK